METKKSVKANLEKARSTFLLIGVILVTTSLIFAFNWSSIGGVAYGWDNDEKIPEDRNTVVTIPEPIPDNSDKKETVKKVILEIITLVDKIEEIKEPVELWTDDDPVLDPIKEKEPEGILPVSEIMPEPFGGMEALRRFLAKNLRYPAAARENNIQGTVHLRFEVTKTGSIGKVEVFNTNQDQLLVDAAVEVIKKLPKFKPGMQNGKKVNVWFSIPVTFKLN